MSMKYGIVIMLLNLCNGEIVFMRKRIVGLLLFFSLFAGILSSCGKNTDTESTVSNVHQDSEVSTEISLSTSKDVSGDSDDTLPGVGLWLPIVAFDEMDDYPTTYTYYDNYLLLSESDGVSVTYYEYSAGDVLMKSTAFLLDEFGNEAFLSYENGFYDKYGNIISEIADIDGINGGPFYYDYSYEYVPGDEANPIKSYNTFRYYEDGVEITEKSVSEMTYDADGNLIMLRQFSEGETEAEYTYTYMYKQVGDAFLTEQIAVYGLEEDIEHVTTYSFAYDDDGHLTEKKILYEVRNIEGLWDDSMEYNLVFEPIVYPEAPVPGQTVTRQVIISSSEDDSSWSYEEEYKYVLKQ